jgi:cupin fold WbuC family metalloprotein
MTGFKAINDEVLIAETPIVQVSRQQMDHLKAQAMRNPRHRVRLCAHKDSQDRLHEMLIVLTKEVYIRPHKHLQKAESFHVIEGSAVVVFFDDQGGIEEVIRIGDFASGKQFYFRNDDPRYHTQLITSDFLVFHETTNGPFNRADTIFAPWAPEEADVAGCRAYIDQLKRDASPA